MKISLLNNSRENGFSLLELLFALMISTIVITSLSKNFATRKIYLKKISLNNQLTLENNLALSQIQLALSSMKNFQIINTLEFDFSNNEIKTLTINPKQILFSFEGNNQDQYCLPKGFSGSNLSSTQYFIGVGINGTVELNGTIKKIKSDKTKCNGSLYLTELKQNNFFSNKTSFQGRNLEYLLPIQEAYKIFVKNKELSRSSLISNFSQKISTNSSKFVLKKILENDFSNLIEIELETEIKGKKKNQKIYFSHEKREKKYATLF